MKDKLYTRITLLLIATFTVLFSVACTLVQAEGESVSLCHIPPGNPEKARVIEVAPDAVPAHLEHGDFLGTSCDTPEPTEEPGTTVTPTTTITSTTTITPTTTITSTTTVTPTTTITPTTTMTPTTTITPTTTVTPTTTIAPTTTVTSTTTITPTATVTLSPGETPTQEP